MLHNSKNSLDNQFIDDNNISNNKNINANIYKESVLPYINGTSNNVMGLTDNIKQEIREKNTKIILNNRRKYELEEENLIEIELKRRNPNIDIQLVKNSDKYKKILKNRTDERINNEIDKQTKKEIDAIENNLKYNNQKIQDCKKTQCYINDMENSFYNLLDIANGKTKGTKQDLDEAKNKSDKYNSLNEDIINSNNIFNRRATNDLRDETINTEQEIEKNKIDTINNTGHFKSNNSYISDLTVNSNTIHFKTINKNIFKDIDEIKIIIPKDIKITENYLNTLQDNIMQKGFSNELIDLDSIQIKKNGKSEFEKMGSFVNKIIMYNFINQNRDKNIINR